MTISLIRAANQFQFMTRGLATFEAQVARNVVLEAKEDTLEAEAGAQEAQQAAEASEQASKASENIAAGHASDALTGGWTLA